MSLETPNPGAPLAERAMVIERTRAQLPPGMQNLLAAMSVVREPVSVQFLTHLSSNPDGMLSANKVVVTEADTQLLIDVFDEAERRFGITLLERSQIPRSHLEQEARPATPVPPTDALATQEMVDTYRLIPQLQEYIAARYPQLAKASHSMVADRLWADLGLGDPVVDDRFLLISGADTLGEIIDTGVTKLIAPPDEDSILDLG